MEEKLEQLCSAAVDQQFEVGFESQFSKNLQQLCDYDPPTVLSSLKTRLTGNISNPEVLAEILRWASRQEASSAHSIIVDLLSTGLNHQSSLVRDAAALGLASLDEVAAIGPIQSALEREEIPELRDDMESLVHSLMN